MASNDDFDGGGLLALFGFEDEEPQRPAPAQPPAQPRPSILQATPSRPPPTPPSPPRRARNPLDLRNLSSDDIVRSIVLADVLGPPPGKRGRRR